MKLYFRPLLLCLSIFALPLLLANNYYIDDNGRATYGHLGWGSDGRPLADLMMKALLLSAHVTDIFPLPLIIAVVILAASMARFAHHFLSERPLSHVLLVTMAFLCNPYVTEIFSYRFDVLTLSAAIGLSLLYCCWTDRGKQARRFVIGSAIIIAVYCLYQTVINIVVMMAIMAFFLQLKMKTAPAEILTTLLRRIAELAAGSLIYLKIILPATFSNQNVTNHPTLAAGDLISTIISNTHSYAGFINATLIKHQGGMRFLLILLVVTTIAAGIISWRYIRHRPGPIACLIAVIALLAPLVALIMIPGSLLLLQNPITVPRSLVALSGFMLLCALLFNFALPKKLNFLTWLLILPVLNALTFFYAYGNSLREQAKLNDNLVQDLKTDTRALDYNTLYFVYNGNVPYAPVLKNALRNYPAIGALVPSYFRNWYWSVGHMRRIGVNAGWPIPEKALPEHYICRTRPFAVHQDYTLWKEDDVLVVDFNRTRCQ